MKVNIHIRAGQTRKETKSTKLGMREKDRQLSFAPPAYCSFSCTVPDYGVAENLALKPVTATTLRPKTRAWHDTYKLHDGIG